jgi:hypothetical protein
MVSCHVFTRAKPRRADGQVIRLLQQCFKGETQKKETDNVIQAIMEPTAVQLPKTATLICQYVIY